MSIHFSKVLLTSFNVDIFLKVLSGQHLQVFPAESVVFNDKMTGHRKSLLVYSVVVKAEFSNRM